MTVSHVRGSDTGHLIEHTFPQLARQYAREQKKNPNVKKKNKIKEFRCKHLPSRRPCKSCFVTFTTDNSHLRFAYDRLTLTFTVVNGQELSSIGPLHC